MKPPVSRREYKVMLDQRLFADRKQAAESLCRELHATCKRLKGIECDGEFSSTKKREIVFLDTKDQTIRLNRLIFRQRTDQEGKRETEYTLKCRSPDRYIAAGAVIAAGKGHEDDIKFEEDIAAPFAVRFSHSNTVVGKKEPETLKDAAKIFPALGELERDGEPCSNKLELRPVNSLIAYERVLNGPLLRFKKLTAEIALILWSDGADGRPLVAEFSFRYEDKKEGYGPKAVAKAMEFYTAIQQLDWCSPSAATKTQWMYGE